jgi:hypothetical protein
MITGAIIGTIGGVINKGISLFEVHQKAKIDEKRRSDEIEMSKINADKEIQNASYMHDSNLGHGSSWVINILRLVRPSITAYGLIIVSVFWFFANEQDKSLIIASALDLTTMAVAWWFGSRR